MKTSLRALSTPLIQTVSKTPSLHGTPSTLHWKELWGVSDRVHSYSTEAIIAARDSEEVLLEEALEGEMEGV